ncbi:MAG: hypothetical protein Q7K57_55830 [Burkholderiaceae bacterium]|nr:hypothetical protein [Burkholderiaceae bacterium]
MGKEFRIGGKSIGLFAIRGVVAGSSSSSTRDYSERYSNLMGGLYLHSELREATSFFLLRDDGGELAVSFPDQIALREGHRVTVIYGTCRDGKTGSAIAMSNETTGHTYEMPVKSIVSRLDIKRKDRTPVSNLGCLTILVVIAFVILSAVISPDRFLQWTLGSPIFWMFIAGWFVVTMAGAYVIDPLINAGEIKRVRRSLQEAVADLQAGLAPSPANTTAAAARSPNA